MDANLWFVTKNTNKHSLNKSLTKIGIITFSIIRVLIRIYLNDIFKLKEISLNLKHSYYILLIKKRYTIIDW